MPTTSKVDLCQDCRGRAPQLVPCRLCTEPTSGDEGYCRHCVRVLCDAAAYQPDPTDALTDGAWVSCKGVRVWRTSAPRPPDIPPCISHNTERGWQWHRDHRINWPLPLDDPCGCRAAHYAHVAFVQAMNRRARAEEAA